MINEEEAEAIRVIYDQYVHTDIGANGIAKYLENHGIRKIPRQNGKNPLFDAHLIRLILKNPVYCGKIAYGRRKMKKCAAPEMSTSWWSRTTTCWQMVCTNQLFRKRFGKRRR